jgi:hypothetical protein
MHLVGFTIEVYHNARSYKRQIESLLHQTRSIKIRAHDVPSHKSKLSAVADLGSQCE